MTDKTKPAEIGNAERIKTLRLKSGRSELELANGLGITLHSEIPVKMPIARVRSAVVALSDWQPPRSPSSRHHAP